MKVKELIEKLKEYDEELEVRITDPECCGCKEKEMTDVDLWNEGIYTDDPHITFM